MQEKGVSGSFRGTQTRDDARAQRPEKGGKGGGRVVTGTPDTHQPTPNARTHARTHERTHARTHARMHERTNARMHARTRTRERTHA